jgi:hypothetical protein
MPGNGIHRASGIADQHHTPPHQPRNMPGDRRGAALPGDRLRSGELLGEVREQLRKRRQPPLLPVRDHRHTNLILCHRGDIGLDTVCPVNFNVP